MGFIRSRLAALAGTGTPYQAEPAWTPDLDRLRSIIGGQLSPVATTQTRWYPADVERAQALADGGDLSLAMQLWRASCADGVVSGVLGTRTSGLVSLPKKFLGDARAVSLLSDGVDSAARSVFDDLCPEEELAALASDGIGGGVFVGEMVPVPGRRARRLVRHLPEFLRYRATEDRWYLQTVAGPQPITPGDGRWVLGTPGGRIAPWHNGLWRPVGRGFIFKEHAIAGDDNWRRKLANPARVAQAPQGSTEEQRQDWWQRVLAWGYNTVFGVTPGYEVKLLESNGRGYEAFSKAIERSDRENIIAIAGQVVTTDGGAGFSNSDIHRVIRADLIKMTARSLAYVVNTQILPGWVVDEFGEGAIGTPIVMRWKTDPPKDVGAIANATIAVGNAIVAVDAAVKGRGLETDAVEFAEDCNVPLRQRAAGTAKPETKTE